MGSDLLKAVVSTCAHAVVGVDGGPDVALIGKDGCVGIEFVKGRIDTMV